MASGEISKAARAILMVPVDKIDVADDRLRSLKFDQAAAIGQAIKADRQYDPITVRMRVGTDRFWLVDGLHRLEGHRIVGLTEIEARMGAASADKARWQEIMSAWARAGHDAFDKASQVAAMVDLCRDEAGSDDDEAACSTMLQALRWDEAAAEALGVHRTTVFRSLKIHRGFSAEQIALLRDKKMADDLMPLTRVAALPPEDFETVMNWIATDAVASIAEALAMLAPEKQPVWEKTTRKVVAQIADWPSMYRKRLIDELLTKYDRYGNDKSAKDAAR